MGGGGANILLALPALLVLVGLFTPIVMLDGAAAYLGFLWRNPMLLVTTVASWWVLAYWCARRVASVLLLRSSGAKLRVGDASRA